MRPRPWHLAAGLAFAGLQIWIVTRVTDEPDADGAARAASLEQRIEQADRRAETAVLHAAAARAEARQAAPADPPATPDALASGDDEETQVPLEERLDEAFARETRDPSWSATAHDAARAAVANHLPSGSWIRDLDCRGTLCRIQIGHAGAAGHDALIDAVAGSRFAWTGPFAVERADDDGSLMFLGKACADGEDCAWH